ncbi:MAG: hypothetical protein APF80_00035 [Alphaproteobacteria bacterium BRH_c36]|nr:MAG: hypothetical protein APF80_00035 [Alphaproteobacteria bacterium BRH_c36]
MKKTFIAIFTVAVVAAAALAVAKDEEITFPADYKSYKNYLSLDRVGNPDQIIRLFANGKAAAGPGADGKLAEGSVLVGEIYKAKLDDKGQPIESTLGRRIRDKLAAIAVMEKRAGWGSKFPEEFRNGDWDFAVFSPDGKRLDKDLNTCRACHASLKDTDHLYSFEHLK